MYTTIALITWALIALVTGFAAGWLVGLFQWKKKAKTESVTVDDGWKGILAQHQKELDMLKQLMEEQTTAQPQEAQSEAPKKI